MPTHPSAADLYAVSQGTRNDGTERCHWCRSACKRHWLHDDPPPVPFTRSTTTALCPSEPWICAGCWLFRRRAATAFYLRSRTGPAAFRDGRSACAFSWLVTEAGAWAIEKADHQSLWDVLLKPPLRFALMLRRESDTLLQLAICSDNVEGVKGNTPTGFTIDNVPHWYTIYDLEHALRTGKSAGKEPGVPALLSFLEPFKGKIPEPATPVYHRQTNKRHDPQESVGGKATQKVVAARSGG